MKKFWSILVVAAVLFPTGRALAHHRPDHGGGPPADEEHVTPREALFAKPWLVSRRSS